MSQLKNKSRLHSNSGFIVADFLFSFVLVIGIGIVIFGLTFSLATIEIAQYIVWSSARNYSAGFNDEATAALQAKLKFKNLSQQFPSLTGQNTSGGSSWFNLELKNVGDLAKIDSDFNSKVTGSDIANLDAAGEQRQPWTGVSAQITLKLFSSLRIPFLGKVTDDTTKFTFPIRAFILRSPSQAECKEFFKFENRFAKGIKQIDSFKQMNTSAADEQQAYVEAEDNGC